MGIYVDNFVVKFLHVLKMNMGLHHLKWVCFHGLYELAYLLKFLTENSMSGSVVMFAKALG